MKTFWPTFWVTLAAILVAAAAIYGLKLRINTENRREAMHSEIQSLEQKVARLKEQLKSHGRRAEKALASPTPQP
jgi:hypothetical protein